jgi:hypothetical protein
MAIAIGPRPEGTLKVDNTVIFGSCGVMIALAAVGLGIAMLAYGTKALRAADGGNLFNARLLVAGGSVLIAAPVLVGCAGLSTVASAIPRIRF